MEIYPATPNDAQDMAYILNTSWSSTYAGIIPNETIEARNASRLQYILMALEDHSENYYIVRQQQTPVAVMCFGPSIDEDTPRYTYEVMVMYVHPDYTRQGIGSRMMDYVVKQGKKLRMKRLKVWVLSLNTNAINFYKKNGFVADGKTKMQRYGVILELMRMERKL